MIKKGLTSLAVVFLYLVSLLPFWLLYLLSDFIYLLIYYVVGYRRKVVQQNLLKAFPGKTVEERSLIERKFFRYLADVMIETLKAISMSKNEVNRRMTITNLELIDGYLENRSVIAGVGHYSNWEWGVLRSSTLTDRTRVIVYKPLNNDTADGLYKRLRGRFGATLVPMKGTFRKMIELRKEITFNVFASDQTPIREEANYFTNFLNQPTAVFLGIEKIAKAIDAVVVFADIRRLKRGFYECTFITITENPKQTAEYEITQAHLKCLENIILEEPPYWLWSHRRWKLSPNN